VKFEAANVSEITKAMESSVSILQSENEHSSEPGRAKAVVSPVIQSPGGTEARHVAVPRARKVRHVGIDRWLFCRSTVGDEHRRWTLERREGDDAFVPRKTVQRFQFFIAEYMD
jgi:hypothetical protein